MEIYIALSVAFIWLALLSFMVWRSTRHYKKLTKRTTTGSIDEVLEKMMKSHDSHASDIKTLQEGLDELDTSRHGYFQKFGYVKFNPFNDRVAGEQSFVIALLDNHGNGFVKTFLYTRDGVRVYVKKIKSGKSADFDLSDEEKEAIKNAS